MISDKSKKFLLAIARQTLIDYFKNGKKLKLDEQKLPMKELTQKAATFVTLTKNDELRGCVGSLIPKKKMYEDVINNTLLAGFGDPRFNPLGQEELINTKIEISILSKPELYNYSTLEELKKMIIPREHGVIVQREFSQATFLPQVWDDIPIIEDFMQALCKKAGLDQDEWKNPETEIFYYSVEKFEE